MQYPRNIGGVTAMRAALTAMMLMIGSQAGAEFGNLCDLEWWKFTITGGL